MRSHQIVVSLLVTLLAVTSASASGDYSRPPAPTGSANDSPDAFRQKTPREEAERWYADAFEDVRKGREDLVAGKTQNAGKRLRRARERAARAVDLDSTFYEAWNLVGYSARKTGDYPSAFAAYERCLRLKPDYAPAREYVGEAYVEVGDLVRAREQLRWLEKLGAAQDAKELQAAIDAAAAGAKPEAATSGTDSH